MAERAFMKVGDRLPVLEAVLRDAFGAPADLTGATVRLFIRAPGGGVTDYACTVVSAAKGRVRYAWAGTELTAAGEHQAEFQATYASGKRLTFPNGSTQDVDDYFIIDVAAALG